MRTTLPLTNFHIKLLAAVLMVIDHTGLVLFDNSAPMRFIGRFSFPLFAWLLVQGEAHTGRFGRYALRLLLFGLISQPIYHLTFGTTGLELNILFTLLLGLLCLRGARRYPQSQWAIWLVGAAIAQLLNVNYGAYGIGAIALTRYYRRDGLWWLAWIGLHLLSFYEYGPSQFPAVASPVFFELTNHQPGAKARWFYWFYPVHLLAIWLIERYSWP